MPSFLQPCLPSFLQPCLPSFLQPYLPSLFALRLQEQGVVRPGAFALAQRPTDAAQRRRRLRGRRLLVQRPVDLRRRPAGERCAGVAFLEPARCAQNVDAQTRHLALRPAARRRIGHFHPQLREAPLLVEVELPPVHVRGVVHLQHHVRQLLPHLHRRAPRPIPVRMQVDRLIRLHDLRLGAGVGAQQQGGGAEHVDGRAAALGDDRRQLRQTLRRILVVGGDGLGDHGDFGAGVPELEAALPGVDFVAGDANRTAAGEVGHGVLPPSVHAQRELGARRLAFESSFIRHGHVGFGHGATPPFRSTFASFGIVAQPLSWAL